MEMDRADLFTLTKLRMCTEAVAKGVNAIRILVVRNIGIDVYSSSWSRLFLETYPTIAFSLIVIFRPSCFSSKLGVRIHG